MHEIGLVDDIVGIINAKLKESKQHSRIKKVNILIGELEHITPLHFEFHFRERTKGTALESAALSFKKVNAKFRCKECNTEFTADEGFRGCPNCNSSVNDIIEGAGIIVESVELE